MHLAKRFGVGVGIPPAGASAFGKPCGEIGNVSGELLPGGQPREAPSQERGLGAGDDFLVIACH